MTPIRLQRVRLILVALFVLPLAFHVNESSWADQSSGADESRRPGKAGIADEGGGGGGRLSVYAADG